MSHMFYTTAAAKKKIYKVSTLLEGYNKQNILHNRYQMMMYFMQKKQNGQRERNPGGGSVWFAIFVNEGPLKYGDM